MEIGSLDTRVKHLRTRVAADLRYHRQKLADCKKYTPNARYHQQRIEELLLTSTYLQTFKIK